MGDNVEIILEYLRRYHFTNAEAAFKAELLARGGDRSPSSVNVLDWDLEWRLRSLQSVDRTLESERISVSAPERNPSKSSYNQDAEASGISLERSTSPSIAQLYGEYNSEKLDSQESLCNAREEFVVENLRISPEPEIAESFAGPYLPSGICEHETPFQIGNRSPEPDESENVLNPAQGWGWTDPFQQRDEPLPGRPSVGSLEDLGERGQAGQTTIESAELSPMWDKRGMQGQQSVGNVAAFNAFAGLGGESHEDDIFKQSQLLENKLSHRKLDTAGERWGFQPGTVLHSTETTESLRNSNQQDCSALERKVEEPNLNFSAAKGHMDFWRDSSQEVEEKGAGSSHGAAGTEESVKNGFITNLTQESFLQDLDLKPAFPFSFLKPSQVDEQQNLVRSEYADRGVVKRIDWVQKDDAEIQETVVFSGHGEAYLEGIGVENLELRSSNDLNGQEELPRLPPVRLRSMDKNIDNCKDGGSAAENSTRSFESAAFRSLGSTPEGNFGWNAFIDVPLGQDVSASGFKRAVSRPSVSQGIVEDMSEQLSGFATAGDGQCESAREYPDEYCDSDAYEDDDDPGYHRQPIEDETWFFAHEIDYPSDDERARLRADKSDHKQFGKLDEDDRSFVEEESYFSGEEFYRSQSAKEGYRLQQSELRNQVDRAQVTYNNLYSTTNVIDLLALPRGDDGNDYNGELFDPEEVKRMRSEPAWKGFIGQSNELEQESVVSGGDRLEGASVSGVDDERHGSVRSGCVGVSSDAADVGSEVRDSLLGGSSEGDIERFRDQEFTAYSPAHGRFVSEEFFVEKEGRHVEVKSAPVRHLDEEEEDDRDIFLRYYNEAWGHKKRVDERDIAERVLKSELASRKHLTNGINKEDQDNGAFVFGGFCFPSPSSTGDIVASRADSGKSLWSNRESAAQGEETDEYGSGVVGPDDTLAAWKRKSNGSSPIVCASEENLPNLNLSNHSTISAQSTDDYVSLEAREDGLEEPSVDQIPECSQALVADDDDAAAVQEEIRRLSVAEDLYEIFDLRIVHRKNRTGFEEDKEFPVVINTVIAGRYHVTEYLGSAAFSKAIQAHDLHTGMDVCMKIIKNNKDFFDQSLDEIKLLKFINKHDPADKHHILRLYDYFYHREHLFIVCELLRANLYEFHKFNRESGGEVYFTMPRLQSITRQCLEALEFLHGLGIIHCDLKPENILVKSYSRCEIKIIDLGSSCFQTDHLCSYVQSRSYRAPEVILGLQYDQKIDIWSLGCILAELCSGNVLFQNDSLATLLARVVGILGPIDPEVLAKGRDTHKYFTKNHMLYERNQETDQLEYLLPKKTSLSHRLPMGDQGFVEFVGYLLRSNPAKRPTATDALKHFWLSHPYEPISS